MLYNGEHIESFGVILHRLAVIILALSAVFPVHASTVAISSFKGGLLTAPTGDQLYGWFFTANSEINVSQLGVYDSLGDGLTTSHDVGIFRVSDHALLGSATIPDSTSGTLLDGFRYTSVTPIPLAAGNYAIVMTMPDSTLDVQFINATSVTTAAAVTWTGSAFIGSSTLVYPGWDGSVYNVGMFGPNFQFDASTSAPEPTPALMLLGAGLALGLLRRRGLHS